jgi:hypothetical protein
MEEFKLELTVNESETARFEVTYIISSGKSNLENNPNYNKLDSLIYMGYKKRIRPLFINRLDKYAGVCEYISREKDIDPEM